MAAWVVILVAAFMMIPYILLPMQCDHIAGAILLFLTLPRYVIAPASKRRTRYELTQIGFDNTRIAAQFCGRRGV